ncbi:MAG: transglutaminase family protein, partial [Magnetospirillum sp.]|nr:transglutaminase family protein [Magnetospirillum sp.]
FRFPMMGEICHAGIRLELRHALEPWHVLGEEPGAGGTVRYVDSSVERLQVKLSNLHGDRYVVTCNGKAVPLAATGTSGEAVAGVRYRAWQPASCLHPTIGVHSPLVFDLVDRWTGQSVGGCTYHVTHPGGRSYDTFPVNSYEAEARRRARFFPFGHSHGPMTEQAAKIHPDYPNTLDLRLQ